MVRASLLQPSLGVLIETGSVPDEDRGDDASRASTEGPHGPGNDAVHGGSSLSSSLR